MASAITECIYDDASFQEFVWKATSGIGYSRWADDADLRTHKFTVAPYLQENIEDAKKNLEELQNLTDEEKAVRTKAFNEECSSFHEKYDDNKDEKRKKLLTMRAHVEEWEIPTEHHENFKSFMLQQIDETIEWDCRENTREEAFEDMSVNEWYALQIEVASSSLQNAISRYAREQKAIAEANSWLEALRASVPPPSQK